MGFEVRGMGKKNPPPAGGVGGLIEMGIGGWLGR